MVKILKNIEISFKKLANMFVQMDCKPIKVEQSAILFYPKRILLLRHDRIGDVLISTSFLNDIRNSLPNIKIDILLSFRNFSAKRAVENLTDDILLLQNKPIKLIELIKTIRKNNYDLIIDLLDNESATSNLILKYSKAKYKLGFDKSNSKNYTHIVPQPNKARMHITERLQYLGLPFGSDVNKQNIKLCFPLKENEIRSAAELLGEKLNKLRLGINLSGSSDAKYWGTENYINFIKALYLKHDIEVILFATVNLKSSAEKISSMTDARIAPIQGDFNIYAAMLCQCDCILTPDTAAVHLASALDIPVIALYQYVDEKFGMPWFPLGHKSKSLVSKDNISAISVEDVLDSFAQLMQDEQ